MASTQYTPVAPNTYLWDTTATTYRGSPVVAKGTGNPYMVTNPAVSAGDIFVGVASMDAGPSAPGGAANIDNIPVQETGVVQMYAKGTINAGAIVKIGSSISVTPAGYSSAITVYTAAAATQTAGGSQPVPVIGIALSASSADGDLIWVLLRPMYY